MGMPTDISWLLKPANRWQTASYSESYLQALALTPPKRLGIMVVRMGEGVLCGPAHLAYDILG
jgi:hypothetical protein